MFLGKAQLHVSDEPGGGPMARSSFVYLSIGYRRLSRYTNRAKQPGKKQMELGPKPIIPGTE